MELHALVVPMDSGFRDWRMGAGPERFVEAGVLEGLRARGGGPVDLSVARFEPSAAHRRGEVASAIEIAQWLAARVSSARSAGAFPLVFAGNCVSSLGTFAGLRARSRRVPGVCWFDAHADFNTPETTETGFLDGMALATLTGRCWTQLVNTVPHFRPVPEPQVLLFGARDIDDAERRALRASEIEWLGARERASVVSDKLVALRSRFGEVYLHIDLDVLDRSEGRANSYASNGGITRERLLDLVREISANFHVGAAALTAYDPTCDPEGRIVPIVRDIVQTLAAIAD